LAVLALPSALRASITGIGPLSLGTSEVIFVTTGEVRPHSARQEWLENLINRFP
jgi:hypothetical protein